MILAACAGEEAIVADAVESARQGVEEEAADELVGGEGPDLLPSGAGLAIILVAEGDPGIVEAEEAAVRYGDPAGVSRPIGEHRLGASKRRLGISHHVRAAWGQRVCQSWSTHGVAEPIN